MNLDEFARFCDRLKTEDGSPMGLEPFQRTLLQDHFAGVIELLVLLPKKNGKTTLKAALALAHVLTTQDAECVVVAAARDQAAILLRQAKGFIDRDEVLTRLLYIKDREIVRRDKGGRVRIMAADADTADGVIPTLAIVDELHRQKSAELYGVLRDGLGPRHGRIVALSVAGDNEASVLGELRATAYRLPHVERAGKHVHAWSDDGVFAMHEWALERDDDQHDMALVKEANPASWQTVDELRRRHDSPSMQPWQWARFACNIWSASEVWWINGDQLRDAQIRDGTPPLRPGDRIAIGFDGSRTNDATGIVGCRLDDGVLGVLGLWEKPAGVGGADGWAIDGGAVDNRVSQVMNGYQVVRGYFDPPLWQTEIDAWARQYGQPAVVPFSTNGTRMQHATERFRTDLTEGRAWHHGDPDLVRHVLNARMREVRGGYYLVKDRPSSPDKIDLAVCAVLAWEARADALSTPAARPGRLITFS